MEDSREKFSFEIDDLSSADSELFGSEEMGDISELLEDFEKQRDDTTNSEEDVQVPSEHNITKDSKGSRIPILKNRGMLDNKMKSEESLFASASKIPVRISNSSCTVNKRLDKEQFKRNEKMTNEGKESGMKKEEMEPEDTTALNQESVTLRTHGSMESAREKWDESNGARSKLTETESTEDVFLKQGEIKRERNYQDRKLFSHTVDAGDDISEIKSMSEKKAGDYNVKEKDLNVQGHVQEMANILLEQGETKQEWNQEPEILALDGVDGENIREKELINEMNQSDQNVKEKDLQGQECVKDKNEHLDDIIIPSLPVYGEGSDEDSLNNGNDKNVTKNNMSNGNFDMCTYQRKSMEFGSPPLEADNEQLNKGRSNFKDYEKNEECALAGQKDIATPPLIRYTQGFSDDNEKMKDENDHSKRKKNDPGENSSSLNLENVTVLMSSLVGQGSDVETGDDRSSALADKKAKVYELNEQVNPSLTEGGSGCHESNRKGKRKIKDLSDSSFEVNQIDEISSTCVDSGGVMTKNNKSGKLIGKKYVAHNGKKTDLDELTASDGDEISSVTLDGEEMVYDNEIERKIKLNDQSRHNSEQEREHLRASDETELDMDREESRGAISLADDGEGDERATMSSIKKSTYHEEKAEKEEEEIGTEFDIISASSIHSDDIHSSRKKVRQNETKFEKPKNEDDSDNSCDDSNIEFDDDNNNCGVPDDAVKSKKPGNILIVSKTAQNIVKDVAVSGRNADKEEEDDDGDEVPDYETAQNIVKDVAVSGRYVDTKEEEDDGDEVPDYETAQNIVKDVAVSGRYVDTKEEEDDGDEVPDYEAAQNIVKDVAVSGRYADTKEEDDDDNEVPDYETAQSIVKDVAVSGRYADTKEEEDDGDEVPDYETAQNIVKDVAVSGRYVDTKEEEDDGDEVPDYETAQNIVKDVAVSGRYVDTKEEEDDGDEVPDYETAQNIVKDVAVSGRYADTKEEEDDGDEVPDDETNTSEYVLQNKSIMSSTEKPSCSEDMKEYRNCDQQTPKAIAECPKICLTSDGTIKYGQNFTSNKTPVPTPRKKKKTTTAALISREKEIDDDDTVVSNEELKQRYNDLLSEISYEKKSHLRPCDDFANGVKKEMVVVTEVRSSKFEKEHDDQDDYNDDDFGKKGLIDGRKDEYKSEQSCPEGNVTLHTKNENEHAPKEKIGKTCLKPEEAMPSEETSVEAPRSEYGQIGCDHFRNVETQQVLHENKSQTQLEENKYREGENIDLYDTENYLLPQDIQAFSPPFCSTPYSERVTIPVTPEIQVPFEEDKNVCETFSIVGHTERNDHYEIAKGKESGRENKEEAENNYERKKDIKFNPFSKEGGYDMGKLMEDDGVFYGRKKDDVGYEDNESIYATSIVTEDFGNPSWFKRNIGTKSPEYEELNVVLRGIASSVRPFSHVPVSRDIRNGGTSHYNVERPDDVVASFRHIDDTVKRREERSIGDKKNNDVPTWGTQQPSHKRQSYRTGALRHQSPSVQISRGVSLDKTCGTQSYDNDLLKPSCTNSDQTSHRWPESTESHFPSKPSRRNSAFVPFESSVRGRVDYHKKRGSPKEKRRNESTEELNKDLNRSGKMKYTSDSSSFQRKNDKFHCEDCSPTEDARCASGRALDDRKTIFAMTGQLNYNTEPRIEKCFDQVQHSTPKSSEINLPGFPGSQIGTLHVITFPLSRGPGISVERGDSRSTSGIYVREIIEGGDAHHDGRLRPGDRLLTVNGYNLSIASLSQAKSVLRKLKQAHSESFATIRFIRESDDISVEDMDSSLDQSVTLPFFPNETTHMESNTFGKQEQDSSYLKEELILPNPLMASTPIDVTTSSRARESGVYTSYNNETSSGNFHDLHNGLLMLAPNTKVHLSQLESSLSFLGLNLSSHQKNLLRSQLEVDSDGYVVYEEFATAARDIYSLDLSVREPLVYPDLEMKPLPDIVPRPSINSVLATRREFDQLVSEKNQIKEEIQEIKKRLSKKAKMLRNMEDELTEVRNDLKQVQNRKMILLNKERDLEEAKARTSSKIQDYTKDVSSLEKDIISLKASNVVPITSQLVSKCASVNKQIQNLVTRVRSVQKSNRIYHNTTQKLMAFAHKVHKIHQERGASSVDHTYQTVDQIPVSKSRGVKNRHRKVDNQNELLSREASRVISTVQGILSHEPLPFGWEEAYTEMGSKFYIDHMSGVTTWQLPTSIS